MIETVPSGTILHGRYRIERVLGSGGFGHVYLAIDTMTNQQCAIKEYLVTGATGQEQLQHEARVLSQLHHPNLPAFAAAFIERGRYYVTLSYIEGNDLTDLIRMTRQRNDIIPIRQMLIWLLSTCEAVMFLHSQNPTVIHRDIKPDNIRIQSNGTAVLVDLGNAKAAADGARTLFFIRHQGTPGYAPPEQYPGGTGTDARSDIYALGATLYFALTATEPPSVSTRNQAIQQGHPDLPSLQEHLANNPPRETLEYNAARQFRLGVTKPGKPEPRHSYHIAQLGQIPPESLKTLNAIIERAMALRPRDRYQYVADFANDLKNVITILPAPPSPDSTHPKDSNITQPDLNEAYEALQASRDNQGPDTSPSTQPMGSNSSSISCPRCQAQLPAGTPFCPRCGTPLSGGPSTRQGSRNSVQPGQAQPMAMVQASHSGPATTAAQDVRSYGQDGQIQQHISSPGMTQRSPQQQISGQQSRSVSSPHYGNQGPISKATAAPVTGFSVQKFLPLILVLLIIVVIVVIFMLMR